MSRREARQHASPSSQAYQSLGGDGYESPGRRANHPNTDLVHANVITHQSRKWLFLSLCTLLVLSSMVLIVFTCPRPLSSSPSLTPSHVLSITSNTSLNRDVWHINHSFVIENVNWAPVTLESSLTFVTLMPGTDPVRPECGPGLLLGIINSVGKPLPSRQSTTYTITNATLITDHELGWRVFFCRDLQCEQGGINGTYRVALDSIARVSYLSVEADLVIPTVNVDIKCTAGNIWTYDSP